jgi:tetratricopeptide (TPR) repeat protein
VPTELTGHPDAETLAEYLEGGPAGPERSRVQAHLIVCGDCRTMVADAAAFSASNTASTSSGAHVGRSSARSFRRSTIVGVATALAAAALLVLAVRLVRPDWLGRSDIRNDREWHDLIAAADAQPTRPIDARLSDGFGYRPPPPVVRGLAGREQTPALRIAVAGVEQRAGGAPSLDDQAALAVALLVAGEVDRAITLLESVVNARPTDATALNDLGAAYLTRAQHGSNADLQKASAVLDRALRAKPDFPEALFNRAIAAELSDPSTARAAWTAYLAVDSQSPWAAEARRRQQP